MKKRTARTAAELGDELRPEYNAEFFKHLRPNPYAARVQSNVVRLDPDVAQVFDSSESVNRFLRSAIEAVTHRASAKTVRSRTAKRRNRIS